MENSYYKVNRHSCFKLEYHLVVATRYRHPVLTEEISNFLKEIIYEVFETHWKCSIISVNTDGDHVHILFEAPPQVQLSKLINNFKTVSSRLIRKKFPEYLSKYYWKPYFWSMSYYIGSISNTTEEVVKKYIENQGCRR